MVNRFTPEASLDLGGPEWLAERRLRAFSALQDVEWPTADEEIWRYSRVGDLDLSKYRPMTAAELGQPGIDSVPGGGPVAAELGARSALLVVRDGRVVHREIDPALEALGVVVGDLAMLDADTAVGRVGLASDASPDAFTLLHDAFLAGGAYIHVPRGVVVELPIVVIHWCDGEGVASFPHTIVVADESSQVSVLERFGSPNVDHFGRSHGEVLASVPGSDRVAAAAEGEKGAAGESAPGGGENARTPAAGRGFGPSNRSVRPHGLRRLSR